MATPKSPGEIYPCSFPIKIIGDNNTDLEKITIRVLSMHGEVINLDNISATPSKNGKYLSLTVTITARSREHVDGIYAALNAHEQVKMVL